MIGDLKDNKTPLILVTNDDGIHAPGLKNLIETVRPLGRVVVVAPDEGRSGQSHAITIKIPLRVFKLREEENFVMYSCTGTPVDCVKLAVDQILDRYPDLLISGINHGSNSSISVVYSGTMAAAMEGGLHGIPSIGFSLLDYSIHADFSHVLGYVREIAETVLLNGLPEKVCLNVNFPVFSDERIRGVKICRQALGIWKGEFEKRTDPHTRDYYWLTGYFKNFEPEAEDTDEHALQSNYVSIVPVKVDLTSHSSIQKLKTFYETIKI
jgi:5'-nucleotidase